MKTTEKHIRRHADSIDWTELTRVCDIFSYPADFIHEFIELWDWRVISSDKKLTEKFMRDYKDFLNWSLISTHQNMTFDFIEEMSDKIDWILVTTNRNFIFLPESENFMRRFQDRLDWGYASQCMHMTESFILEFDEKVNWHLISHYQDLSLEFLRKHKVKLFSIWKQQVQQSRGE